VHVYPGNYEDYLYRKQGGGAPRLDEPPPAVSVEQPAAQRVPAASAAEPAQRPRRLNPMKVRQLEQQAAELEEAAARLEQEIAGIELSLQTFVSAEETRRRMELLEERRRELEQTMAEWERVALELEQMA
jgi:ATP-binding cassette subfamily F protein 3